MNNHLPVGLHILGFLASRKGESLTSDELAQTYGTSPVVVRRVLAKLQRAGLVDTQRGVGGGSILARPPAEIDLREAYEAVVGDTRTLLPMFPDDCRGAVAPVLGDYVNELFEEAQQALLKRLESVSVADMDRVVRRRIMKRARC